MNRFLILVAALLNGAGALAQSAMVEPVVQAANVTNIDYVSSDHSAAAYLKQERYWENQVNADPENANSWLNYYKAVRYKAMAMEREKEFQPKLDSIDNAMGKDVSGSYEQLFVHYWNGHHDVSRYASLEAAYRLQPADPEVLRQLIGYHVITGNGQKAAQFAVEWEQTGDEPKTCLSYAYNVLQSLPQNAVIITNGEYDTYPLVEQKAKNKEFATIKILPLSLSEKSTNRAKLFASLGVKLPDNDSTSVFDATYVRRISAANPDKKIYVAATVDRKLLTELQSELYLTGLAFRYSATAVDNLVFLRDNVGVKMKLDYLDNSSGGAYSGMEAGLNANYLLPLFLAAEEFDAVGQKKKASDLRAKAVIIAQRSGKTKELQLLQQSHP